MFHVARGSAGDWLAWYS